MRSSGFLLFPSLFYSLKCAWQLVIRNLTVSANLNTKEVTIFLRCLKEGQSLSRCHSSVIYQEPRSFHLAALPPCDIALLFKPMPCGCRWLPRARHHCPFITRQTLKKGRGQKWLFFTWLSLISAKKIHLKTAQQTAVYSHWSE